MFIGDSVWKGIASRLPAIDFLSQMFAAIADVSNANQALTPPTYLLYKALALSGTGSNVLVLVLVLACIAQVFIKSKNPKAVAALGVFCGAASQI